MYVNGLLQHQTYSYCHFWDIEAQPCSLCTYFSSTPYESSNHSKLRCPPKRAVLCFAQLHVDWFHTSTSKHGTHIVFSGLLFYHIKISGVRGIDLDYHSDAIHSSISHSSTTGPRAVTPFTDIPSEFFYWTEWGVTNHIKHLPPCTV